VLTRDHHKTNKTLKTHIWYGNPRITTVAAGDVTVPER
jgi:hypothetical protein